MERVPCSPLLAFARPRQAPGCPKAPPSSRSHCPSSTSGIRPAKMGAGAVQSGFARSPPAMARGPRSGGGASAPELLGQRKHSPTSLRGRLVDAGHHAQGAALKDTRPKEMQPSRFNAAG